MIDCSQVTRKAWNKEYAYLRSNFLLVCTYQLDFIGLMISAFSIKHMIWHDRTYFQDLTHPFCAHVHRVYICMEIWLACTTQRALSAWCLDLPILSRSWAIFHLLLLTFNKVIVSFRSPTIRSSWEHRKSTVKNSLAEATNCNKGQGWLIDFLRWPLSAL